MIKKTLLIKFLYFSFLFLINSSIFAQAATNDNLCTQIQCVKIQNGYLWVLSSDNVTYVPYFVKAVGYQPLPIGRHPSDWGYASTDSRYNINNIYDDPAILNRDFSNLQQIHANTIRIWNGNNLTDPSGRYPNKLTINTLDMAQQYNLRIIPGFYVNPLVFDFVNNISSTDNNGNLLNRQQIINNFVSYVNAFKGNPVVLFWAIGNENNYQLINGQKLTPQQLISWYSLVNDMAQAAHNAEGANFHPVAVVNGEIAEIGNFADGAADSQLPDLDIWGANIYRGQSFGTLFSDYAAKSNKPLWISEFGVDAFSTSTSPAIIADVNNWQLQMTDPGILIQEGSADQATQSSWDGALWNEIVNNSPVTIGGSVMEYSDEWWKPNEWMCSVPNPYNDPAIQAENVQSVAYCISTHSNFGIYPYPPAPDDFSNEQWFGMMSISQNPVVGGPDIMTPRTIYHVFQTDWQANPWPYLTLNISGSGMGSIKSSISTFGGGLNCKFSSDSNTGICLAPFTKNQQITLSFSSSNNSTVTNWGVSGCASGSTTCNITPDTDITLNVTVTAPPAPTVSITSPGNGASYTAPTGITLTAKAAASAVNTTIASVTFYYNGSTFISTVISSPYSYSWSNVPAGTYNLTAVVTDSNGSMSVSSAVLVTVNPTPLAPIITTQPQSQTVIAPAPVTFTAAANGVPAPTYQWEVSTNGGNSFTPISGATGATYTITSTTTSLGGNKYKVVATNGVSPAATSSAATLTVNPASAAPTITIQPLSQTVTEPASATFSVAASGAPAPTYRWQQMAPGANIYTNIIGATSSIFTTTATTVADSGTKYECVVANSLGSVASSAATLIVNAPRPTVEIISPVNGARIAGGFRITINAIASEAGGIISKVAFYNGKKLLGTVARRPYNYTWYNVPAGVYNLTAVATDSAAVTATSSVITVVVAAISYVAPTVDIISPSNNATYIQPANITLTASASSPNGIRYVKFYNASKLIGVAFDRPYTYTWNSVDEGVYSITAVAIDNTGLLQTTSSAVNVTVSALSTPDVSIVSPVKGAYIGEWNSSLTITANASSSKAAIISVAFYASNLKGSKILLGTITNSPYTYTWRHVPEGIYYLTAVATDSAGAKATSAAVFIISRASHGAGIFH
ncbi:MAG: immunoglobulin domain-containing protein [Candidatus Omnitrophica bacterium]|nr:immunoglobulin domain-containing protein [Candidatus Omnitrophota bacterium]